MLLWICGFLGEKGLGPLSGGVGRGNFKLEIFERIINTNYIRLFHNKKPEFVVLVDIYIRINGRAFV